MSTKRVRLDDHREDEIQSSSTIRNQAAFIFCDECKKALPVLQRIFFPKSIFSSNKSSRIRIGNIYESIKREEFCHLCKFFVETLQLHPEKFQIYGRVFDHQRNIPVIDEHQTNIYLVLDSQPWFEKAGITIKTGSKSCEYCWLQIGPEAEKPLICLSLDLLSEDRTSFQRRAGRIYPTRRAPIEAYNGNCDRQIISKWLQKCDAHHKSCSLLEETNVPQDLMLIDVENGSLIPYTRGAQFLTLSYVWGKGASQQQYYVKPEVDNQRSKKSRLANCRIPESLPRTIEDAIQITKDLGKQYLWVDVLCIDQEDEIGKQEQIEAMDQIYALSWLTLVCCDGPDVNYGLPGGFRSMIHTKQPSVLIPDGRLMATYISSYWTQNGRSHWDQRAWTLQEHLLSRRCLFFADTYFSMICKEEVFHELVNVNIEDAEETLALADTHFREDGSSVDLDLNEWDFDNYGNLVSVFTGRKITDQNDVHNACQGSLNRMSLRTKCEFHFGLPKSDLLQALLWVPHHEFVPSKRSGFPTWSWLGWIGRCEYPYWLHWKNKSNRSNDFDDSKIRRLNINTMAFIETNQRECAGIVHDQTMTAAVIQLRTSIMRCNALLKCRSGQLFRTSPT